MYELKIGSNEKILIVAPHPDDESIGMGGLLLKYSGQITVLCVTNGCRGHDSQISDIECSVIRHNEFSAAMAFAGANYIEMNLPDTISTRSDRKNIYKFCFKNYDKIFIPNHCESHADHKMVNRSIRNCWLKMRLFSTEYPGLYEYEVWSPLKATTHYYDITTLIEQKIELVRHYKSQLEQYEYIDIFLSLNRFRGAIEHAGYYECYQQIHKSSEEAKCIINQCIRRIKRKIKSVFRFLK